MINLLSKNVEYLFIAGMLYSCSEPELQNTYGNEQVNYQSNSDQIERSDQIDTALYNVKMKQLANGDQTGRWPPNAVYPTAGAILPFNRIVAYYGNFYSTQMGILGQYSPQQVLEKLKGEIKKWENADTLTPVLPAIHYISVTAQKNPGTHGKYRLRMPFHQVDKALALAKEIDGIVFLDIQVGLSTLQQEIPVFEQYLKMPQVHLAIDPEYSMKSGLPPGKAIGSFDAVDINYASAYLAELVSKNNLPPKILVVHRFTNEMVTNFRKIITRPEVQLVMNMDGFGFPAKKKTTYYHCIYKEPVQFAGFKLFYKNDTWNRTSLMTSDEILNLKPRPIYIQYQ